MIFANKMGKMFFRLLEKRNNCCKYAGIQRKKYDIQKLNLNCKQLQSRCNSQCNASFESQSKSSFKAFDFGIKICRILENVIMLFSFLKKKNIKFNRSCNNLEWLSQRKYFSTVYKK